jgi:hypothetical protein
VEALWEPKMPKLPRKINTTPREQLIYSPINHTSKKQIYIYIYHTIVNYSITKSENINIINSQKATQATGITRLITGLPAAQKR